MTATTLDTELTGPAPSAEVKVRKEKTRVGDKLLHTYTWLVIIWLMFPILAMILFSFNNTPNRQNVIWNGFTLKWWHWSQVNADHALVQSVVTTLIIVVFATVGSTLLGTLMGVALGKYRFRGMGVLNVVLFACISAPEVVMGSSLHSLNVQAGISEGYVTVIIAHIMFCLAFVTIVVRSRVLTLDPSIEEAAKDLGATAFSTFRRVTLPLIRPGIISGALLAFVLSIDDYVVTNFTIGSQLQNFPMWLYGASKLGLPPTVNVIGTVIFAVGLVVAGTNILMTRRRK